MAIPKGTPLDELVNSLRLDEPADRQGWNAFDVVRQGIAVGSGAPWIEKPIVAWYPSSSVVTPQALFQRIDKELLQVGHPVTDEMAPAILGLMCIHRPTQDGALTALNELIAASCQTDSSEYLLAAFPPHPAFSNFNIGNFEVGRVDREKLTYLCRRIGCDFFERYPENFKGVFSIYRRSTDTVAVPKHEIGRRSQLHSDIEHRSYRIVDNYFGLLARHRRALFQRDFKDAQLIYVAAGAALIDVDVPDFWHGGSFVCVFTWKEPRVDGYFCPIGQTMNVEFAAADRKLITIQAHLSKAYGYTGLQKSEIHNLLQTFSRFVTSAIQKTVRSEAPDEAFLNYIIALELVFGEKEASVKSISRRVGVCAFQELSEPLANIEERVKHLYDIRSRFVHAGEEVPSIALDQVRPLIDAVFHCLMRVQMLPNAHERGTSARWLKQIDFIAAAMAAQQPVSAHDLQSAGVATAKGEGLVNS